MIKLVVTDMDNTLYPWVDFIVPAVESMVEAICRQTGFVRLKVVQSLKAVYEKYESNEYPYVLQESSIFRDFPDFGSFDKLVIQPAQAAFAEARRKYMRPYRGVLETLEALKARKVPVVALTDAPRNPAEYRVKAMGLENLLSGLYTLPGFRFPATQEGEALISPHILAKEEQGHYRAACPVVELPRQYEKPDVQGVLQVCRDFSVEAEDVVLVGDSLHKDIALARKIGAVDCWAEYGTYVSREYRERLDVISAAAITRRHAASVLEVDARKSAQAPTYSLSNFAQLLTVLDQAGQAKQRRTG